MGPCDRIATATSSYSYLGARFPTRPMTGLGENAPSCRAGLTVAAERTRSLGEIDATAHDAEL